MLLVISLLAFGVWSTVNLCVLVVLPTVFAEPLSPLEDRKSKMSRMPVNDEGWKSVQTMYEQGRHSDLRIECGGNVYKVHKVIVCDQSTFLARACEGSWKEAMENVIRLPEDVPYAVSAMVRFFYYQNYKVGELNSLPDFVKRHDPTAATDASAHHLKVHVEIYAVAEKYDIPGLKRIAANSFAHVLWRQPSVVLEQPFKDTVATAYAIIPGTDQRLPSIIVEGIRSRPEALEDPDFRAFMDEVPGLGVDLALCGQRALMDAARQLMQRDADPGMSPYPAVRELFNPMMRYLDETHQQWGQEE